MPWRVTSPMHERQRFVLDAEHTPASFAELCRRYGISHRPLVPGPRVDDPPEPPPTFGEGEGNSYPYRQGGACDGHQIGYSSLRHDRGSESSAPFGVRPCRNE